jgi:hypothetical protein
VTTEKGKTMATDAKKLSEEEANDDRAAASGHEAGSSTSMAEHFAGAGGMSAMFDAMARCCGAFASGAPQSPAPTEADEVPTATEATASCGKEA